MLIGYFIVMVINIACAFWGWSVGGICFWLGWLNAAAAVYASWNFAKELDMIMSDE